MVSRDGVKVIGGLVELNITEQVMVSFYQSLDMIIMTVLYDNKKGGK